MDVVTKAFLQLPEISNSYKMFIMGVNAAKPFIEEAKKQLEEEKAKNLNIVPVEILIDELKTILVNSSDSSDDGTRTGLVVDEVIGDFKERYIELTWGAKEGRTNDNNRNNKQQHTDI